MCETEKKHVLRVESKLHTKILSAMQVFLNNLSTVSIFLISHYFLCDIFVFVFADTKSAIVVVSSMEETDVKVQVYFC